MSKYQETPSILQPNINKRCFTLLIQQLDKMLGQNSNSQSKSLPQRTDQRISPPISRDQIYYDYHFRQMFQEKCKGQQHRQSQQKEKDVEQKIIPMDCAKVAFNEILISSSFDKLQKTCYIIGKLYQVLDGKKKFKGNCFLISQIIVVCSSHQINKGGKYELLFPSLKTKQQYCFFSEDIWTNQNLVKYKQFSFKADYGFIRLQIKQSKKLKSKQRLENINFTNGQSIKQTTILPQCYIYGKVDDISEISEDNRPEWKRWTPNSIIQTKEKAKIIDKELQYLHQTYKGMSGSPIFLKNNQIIGIHTSGSQFYKKNYGILFSDKFYQDLIDFLNEPLNNNQWTQPELKKQYDSLATQQYKRLTKFKQNSLSRIGTLLQRLYIQKTNGIQYLCEYLGNILKKIIQKIFQLEKNNIGIQKLQLDEILVWKQKDQNVIDFKKVNLTFYFNQYNQDLRESNLKLIKQIYYKLYNQLIRIVKIVKSSNEMIKLMISQQVKFLQFQNALKTQLNKEFKLTGLPSILFLYNILCDSNWQTKQNYSPFHHSLNFLKGDSTITIKGYNQSLLAFQKCILLDYKNLNNKLVQSILIDWYKYSRNQFNQVQIIRIYVIHLSSLYQRIQKSLKFLKEIYLSDNAKQVVRKNIDRSKVVLNYLNENIINIELKFYSKCLDELQKIVENNTFSFLVSEIQQKQKFNQLKRIKIHYQTLFDNAGIQRSDQTVVKIIKSLAKYQLMFYNQIQVNILQKMITATSQDFKESSTLKFAYQIFQSIYNDNQNLYKTITGLTIEYNNKYPLTEKQIQKNGIPKKQKNQQQIKILYHRIFRGIFREHQSYHNYRISDAKQQQYPSIYDILVTVLKGQTSCCTGFFVSPNIVCTVLHAFKSKQIDKQIFYIKYKGKIGKIENYYNYALKESSSQYNDIVFLKVSFEEKPKLPTKFPTFCIHSNSQKQQKEFQNKKFFGLMLGFAYEKKPVLKKSCGQIQINNNTFHHLRGQPHLSGSLLLIKRPQNQYNIIGIYQGYDVKRQQNIHKYVKVDAKDIKPIQQFILTNKTQQQNCCRFDKLEDIDSSSIVDTLKQYIEANYKTLDHFLLRIIGQVLRLNHHNIYVKKHLTLNNLILNRQNNLNIIFNNLQVEEVCNEDIDEKKFGQKLNATQVRNLLKQVQSKLDIKSQLIEEFNQKVQSLKQFCLKIFKDKCFDHSTKTIVPFVGDPLIQESFTKDKYYEYFIETTQKSLMSRIISNQLLFYSLKSKQPKLVHKIREYNSISSELDQDKKKLRKKIQQSDKYIKKHYQFILKLFQKGADEIFQILEDSSKQLQVHKETALNDGKSFSKYLKTLVEQSLLAHKYQNGFQGSQLVNYGKYSGTIKNWDFILNILKMYKCIDDLSITYSSNSPSQRSKFYVPKKENAQDPQQKDGQDIFKAEDDETISESNKNETGPL